MKAEQAVEKYLCRKVKENYGLCVKLVGYNGIPDRLIITNDGRNYFVEVKTDGGRISPIQEAVHHRLKLMNQKVFVVWNFEQVDKCISEIF